MSDKAARWRTRVPAVVVTPVEERTTIADEMKAALASLHRTARYLFRFTPPAPPRKASGWPEIKVGAGSPAHSPVDRYRCENEDCPDESVWEFRPDDYDLFDTEQDPTLCPSCGEEGELFFRWFRGGKAL